MTVQVASHNFSAIGRMFARQNVPAVYGRQKAAGSVDMESGAQAVDSVDLSSFAPKPLSGEMFSDAMDTGRVINGGGRLSTDRMEKLREDRIFSAVSALAAMGLEGENEGLPASWPAGLPAPTKEEMEEARRRLAQRLQHDEMGADTADLQRERATLLDKVRKSDFSAFSSGGVYTAPEPTAAA